jgi:hypothetical protein
MYNWFTKPIVRWVDYMYVWCALAAYLFFGLGAAIVVVLGLLALFLPTVLDGTTVGTFLGRKIFSPLGIVWGIGVLLLLAFGWHVTAALLGIGKVVYWWDGYGD